MKSKSKTLLVIRTLSDYINWRVKGSGAWVIGRRTKRLIKKYGIDAKFISQKEYDEWAEEYNKTIKNTINL